MAIAAAWYADRTCRKAISDAFGTTIASLPRLSHAVLYSGISSVAVAWNERLLKGQESRSLREG